jgi:hypothetical protein
VASIDSLNVDEIELDLAGSRLNGPTWSLRAEMTRTTEYGWEALLGIRPGLKLLVQLVEGEVWVEAWVDTPDESDGVAVIGSSDTPDGIAAIPLCSCGERGCGNNGLQLAKEIDPDHLPELIETLRDLPWINTIPNRETVLRGSSLTGLPRFELPPGRYKLGSPLTGHYSSFEVLADETVRDSK